jgi:hypothetical protein
MTITRCFARCLQIGLLLTASATAQSSTIFVPGSNFGPIPDGLGQGPLAYGAARDILFNVQNRPGSVNEVRVSFQATHNWVGDLKVQLIAPDGRSHLLFERTGAQTASGDGSDSNLASGVQYLFGDDYGAVTGTNWWTAANAGNEIIGQFNLFNTVISGGAGVPDPAPTTSMTETFRSADPNGTWILRFEDGWVGQTGNVTGAELILTSSGVDRMVTTNADAGPGSLREALTLAQPGDAIRWPPLPPFFIYLIAPENRLPVIPDGVGVIGPDGGDRVFLTGRLRGFRLIEVPANHQVTISGLSFDNANEPESQGGAILNEGVLTLTDCLLVSNTSLGGGAIMNRNGRLTVLRCAFSDNRSTFGGSAIQSRDSARTLIQDSTISAQSTTGAGFDAISVLAQAGSSGHFVMRNSTVTDLDGDGQRGLRVISQGAGSSVRVELGGNLFANQQNLRVDSLEGGTPPVLISTGFNLATDGADGWLDASSDLLNAEADLEPMAVCTRCPFVHPLGPASQAIDRGRAFGPRFSDQRGEDFPRGVDLDDQRYPNAPGSDGSDIGAVEMQSAPVIVDAIFSDRFATSP